MPRRTRAWLHDVPLHVIQRGNNRAACFFAEEDYRSRSCPGKVITDGYDLIGRALSAVITKGR